MATYKNLATIHGSIRQDAFYFPLDVNGTVVPNMIMDTGAFELTFNGKVASALQLPNLGAIRIGGVGGTATAYQSVCSLTLGRKTYHKVPCIVDPGLTESGLFGLRFFVDHGLALTLDTTRNAMFILSPQ